MLRIPLRALGGAAVLGLASLWAVQPAQADITFRIASSGKSLDGKFGQDLDGIYISEDASKGTFTEVQKVDSAGGQVVVGHNANAKVQEKSFSGSGSTMTLDATIDGYRFKLTMTTNQDASVSPGVTMGKVTVSGTITQVVAAGNPPVATNFVYSMSDGKFASPEGPPLFLKSSIFGDFGPKNSNSIGAGNTVSTFGAFVKTGGGEVDTNLVTIDHTHAIKSTKSSSVTSGVTYQLRDVGGGIHMAGNGNSSTFYAQAITYMPEPSGLVMGLLGVPCALGFAAVYLRRRGQTASVAV